MDFRKKDFVATDLTAFTYSHLKYWQNGSK